MVDSGGVDLNLLVTLDALLRERSVSRAAERLGLSQPAVSAQLARLRRHFGDELLARTGNQYRLTPLAIRLKERVQTALPGVERVFAAAPDFDPGSSTREFKLLISDYTIAVLGDTIARLLAEEAPGARLRFVPNIPETVDDAPQVLVNADLLVLPHGFLLAELPHQDLYRDEWVCLVATTNADVGDRLTIEQLETLPWVVTYHGPTASTPAARRLRTLGIEPRVQIVTETFLTIPGLVAGSDRIALLQRRLAGRIPPSSGIRVLPCPFDAGELVEALWWHPIHDDDPEHRYLRDLVVRAAATAAA